MCNSGVKESVMEYRVRYRDIPWSVAIGVLPGKIIGTFCIKPFHKVKRNVMKYVFRFLYMLATVIVLICAAVLADKLTDGQFFAWILHLINQVQS